MVSMFNLQKKIIYQAIVYFDSRLFISRLDNCKSMLHEQLHENTSNTISFNFFEHMTLTCLCPLTLASSQSRANNCRDKTRDLL